MDHIFRIPRLDFSPRKLLHSGFFHNVIARYGVQACTYALPLLTFPYLAHVLGHFWLGGSGLRPGHRFCNHLRRGVRLGYFSCA